MDHSESLCRMGQRHSFEVVVFYLFPNPMEIVDILLLFLAFFDECLAFFDECEGEDH